MCSPLKSQRSAPEVVRFEGQDSIAALMPKFDGLPIAKGKRAAINSP